MGPKNIQIPREFGLRGKKCIGFGHRPKNLFGLRDNSDYAEFTVVTERLPTCPTRLCKNTQ